MLRAVSTPVGDLDVLGRPSGRMLDCLFERHLLERMERVVVNEDADRTLRRKQVCKAADHVRQGIVG